MKKCKAEETSRRKVRYRKQTPESCSLVREQGQPKTLSVKAIEKRQTLPLHRARLEKRKAGKCLHTVSYQDAYQCASPRWSMDPWTSVLTDTFD